jgi:hypothetical protein
MASMHLNSREMGSLNSKSNIRGVVDAFGRYGLGKIDANGMLCSLENDRPNLAGGDKTLNLAQTVGSHQLLNLK